MARQSIQSKKRNTALYQKSDRPFHNFFNWHLWCTWSSSIDVFWGSQDFEMFSQDYPYVQNWNSFSIIYRRSLSIMSSQMKPMCNIIAHAIFGMCGSRYLTPKAWPFHDEQMNTIDGIEHTSTSRNIWNISNEHRMSKYPTLSLHLKKRVLGGEFRFDKKVLQSS